MATFASIEDYIASFPPDVQAILQRVRDTIRSAAPGTEERISYGIPTITLDGVYLFYFAGWKRHISVYPIPEVDDALRREIAPYMAGKGTLRFPLDKPIPYDLIGRLVAVALGRRLAGRS